MDIVILALLVAVLARLTYLSGTGNVDVSEAEFLACLQRAPVAVVLCTQRRISWLLGAPRREWILVYGGHRLRLRAASGGSLPAGADVIHVQRW